MPRAPFTGVVLSLVGPMSVTVRYADVHTLETFSKMKDACDEIVSPSLIDENAESGSGKDSDPKRKGNT